METVAGSYSVFQKRIDTNRSRYLIIAFILTLIGITVFSRYLILHEQKDRKQETMDRGNYLVSLISLHPISDFHGSKSNLFLKTLTDYFSSEEFVYCLVHDQVGNTILTLAPQELASKIPDQIRMKSLFTMGLTNQIFRVNGIGHEIYEFAKPIFNDGERTGTIRLGFKVPPSSIFSPERISLQAMFFFLIMTAGAFVYTMASLALGPLKKLFQSLGDGGGVSRSHQVQSDQRQGVFNVIRDLEISFEQFRETFKNTEADNIEIATRLSVATFENKRILKIIDSIDCGIIITDIQDTIAQINTYMLNLLEMEQEDLIDHPLRDALEEDAILSFIEDGKSISPASPSNHLDVVFTSLAPERTFQVSFCYLKDGDGNIISKMILVKDITSKKSVEKMSQEFIAQVAHEFLTPLTTIRSYNEMLMDEEIEDGETRKEFYNTINQEISRLTGLIQNLLSMAKIEMGGITVTKGPVKTDWLVNDTLMAVEGKAIEKQIAIRTEKPDKFPTIMGDKELLKIAIINLLGNAVKYSPEKSSITFALADHHDSVKFQVSDTGYGISEDDLPHIFDKFYRSKEDHITKQTGSGIGLAMASQIVELHGGEIEVESTPGEGTHFSVTIPKEAYQLGTH